MSSGRPVESIHAMRGVAALAVAVSHLPAFFPAASGTLPGGDGLAVGKAGVDVFFVISGFVMTVATAPLAGGWRSSLGFLWRRIARVVPLYWMVTLFLVALFLVDRRFGAERALDLDLVLRSLLFVPVHGPDGGIRPIVGVGWSLDYEMYFYLCMAAVIAWVPRHRLAVLALAMVTVYLLARQWLDPRVDWVVNAGLALEFLLGVLAALIHRHRVASLVGLALGAAACVAAWPVLAELHPHGAGFDRAASWGAVAFVLILAFTAAEQRRPWQRTRWLGAMGDASYALYLTHSLAFALVQRLSGPLDGPGSLAPRMALMLALATLVSLVVHRWVEKPIVTRLQRLAPGR